MLVGSSARNDNIIWKFVCMDLPVNIVFWLKIFWSSGLARNQFFWCIRMTKRGWHISAKKCLSLFGGCLSLFNADVSTLWYHLIHQEKLMSHHPKSAWVPPPCVLTHGGATQGGGRGYQAPYYKYFYNLYYILFIFLKIFDQLVTKASYPG